MSGWPGSGLPAARAAYGAALLLATARLLQLVTGRPADARARAVVRLLGARHLAQALVTGVRPGTLPIALGAEVDVVHAVSMLGVAALARSQRRSGLIDASVAASFAAAGAALARRLAQDKVPARHDAGPVGRLCGIRDDVAATAARFCLPGAVRSALTPPRARC